MAKKKPSPEGNRSLGQFLTQAQKDAEEKKRVEDLTFKKLKEISTGRREEDEAARKKKLRLKMPWMEK